MFFTCAPGGSETVGPTSNMAIVAPGACSLRMRAYVAAGRAAADDGDVDRNGIPVTAHHPAASSWMSLTDSADSVVG